MLKNDLKDAVDQQGTFVVETDAGKYCIGYMKSRVSSNMKHRVINS